MGCYTECFANDCHDEIRWDKLSEWNKTLVMNMTFMKFDLALEIDPPEKPTNDSSVIVKKLYEDWKHSNKCCRMMMENCMNEAVYSSIPKVDTPKRLL